jgi:diguanylate cyclase (GGDEF)-like protein/PAS domain S-box-containing protein
MSNPPAAGRTAVEPLGGSTLDHLEPTAALAPALVPELLEYEALHPQLRAQLQELQLNGMTLGPELKALLRLISRHYATIDEERRGSVRAMQLMADEARALAREAEEGGHDRLQAILDHIKESVLTVDEQGVVQTFNPTAERIFGYAAQEAIGVPLGELIPQIADAGGTAQGLQRLAQSSGDSGLFLAPQEIWGRRRSGEVFPAEITVGRARRSGRALFVVCLRDVTERRSAERALRESEARYRMLVDHAPEAIVVLDGDTAQFVDANAHAERLFGLPRTELLVRGPLDLSPPEQPNGRPVASYRDEYLARALAGEPQHFEWLHSTAEGRVFNCEVRLLSLPSATRRLVRGTLIDISVRTRAEQLAAAERVVLQRLASGVPLLDVLESITHLVESALPGSCCAVSLLAQDGATFATLIAPQLPQAFQASLGRALVGIRNGSCAAAVYLGRPVAVADISKDSFWQHQRDSALRVGIRAAWSTPIRAGEKILGALGVFRGEAGLPGDTESQLLAQAAQLAGLAVERLYAEEARRRAEQAVLAEKERAQVTLQSIGDAVISTCSRGFIDYLNPVAERLTGWSVADARNRPLSTVLRLVDETTRAAVVDPVRRLLTKGESVSAAEQLVLMTRSGEELAIEQSAAPIRGPEGRVLGVVIVFHDVTQERRLKRALAYQASHDALTGLINRREFDHRLQAAVAGARRGEAQHALLYIDLDQFKLVNDTCGHPAGDRLLRSLTALLQARVRGTDTLARLGGDEFGILLDRCGLEQATQIAETLCQAIHGFRFVWEGTTLALGASIGVVMVDPSSESAATLLSAADMACYAAKEAGRNRVHVYTAQGGSRRHREMQWVARVTRAVEEQRLEIFFQPIVALAAAQGAAERVHTRTVGGSSTLPSLTTTMPAYGARLTEWPPRPRLPLEGSSGAQSAAASLGESATVAASLGSGAAGFCELTVCLRDEDGRLVPPGEFIPAAERYNIMPAIDRWVVAQATELVRRCGAGAPLFAVNLSGTSLNDQSFLDFLLQQVSSAHIARALCFEVTETAAVTQLEAVTELVKELRKRGCRFALDDFGSGVSSFMYLKTLPVDFLKIEGQFVRQLVGSPIDRSMVEAIRQVSRTLGIATIAECVESEGVLEALQRIGVDFVQGYLLAPPQPISQLIALTLASPALV